MMRTKTVRGWLLMWSFTMMLLILFIPWIVVDRFSVPGENGLALKLKPAIELDVSDNPFSVPVYLTDAGGVETVPLEAYVRGVVAAEMPIEFELEALKAQAIAARTYIVRHLQTANADALVSELDGAIVTDTVAHQAYLSEEQLAKRWSFFQQAIHMEKLNRAVNETKGLIATYQDEPIQALFFSTSNGYTENSEDYFRDELPYLRSVPSPWDKTLSDKYEQVVRLTEAEAAQALGLPTASDSLGLPQKVALTAGNRIKTIEIGGKSFTGRQVREKLELPSSHFEWETQDGMVRITTYGYGHGVGMSQYGAHGMALEGATAEQILNYYYQGIRIERIQEYAFGSNKKKI